VGPIMGTTTMASATSGPHCSNSVPRVKPYFCASGTRALFSASRFSGVQAAQVFGYQGVSASKANVVSSRHSSA